MTDQSCINVGASSIYPIDIAVTPQNGNRCSAYANVAYCRWVYLVFFNTLWVWIPLWILYEAYFAITAALTSTAPTSKKVR